MSESQRNKTEAETVQDRDGQGQSSRFTPLRSRVTRARTLTREARGELSRIIPVPRLQS